MEMTCVCFVPKAKRDKLRRVLKVLLDPKEFLRHRRRPVD